MYLLEGNMGAGKSTLLTLINEHLPELEVVFEPVNHWQDNDHNQSLLGQFYENQKRWSYTMEKHTLVTRIKEYVKKQEQSDNPRKIMERSIYSGYYCFAKNGYLQGNMTKSEWEAYNMWFRFLVEKTCQKPLGFIYLYSTPEVCFERMNKRNRAGEETVPLEYLYQLHKSHEAFLTHRKELLPELKNVPVLTLDVRPEFANDPIILRHYLDEITQFINQTHPPLSSIEKTSVYL